MTGAVLLALVLAGSDAPAPESAPRAPGLICRPGEGPRCDCYARDQSRRWRWRACEPVTPAAAPAPAGTTAVEERLAEPRAAPEPEIIPSPAPVLGPEPEPGMSVTATLGGVVTLAGDAGTSVMPSAFVDVDGPLAFGRTAIARIYVLLGITSAPGESINVADVETFRAAKVELGAYRSIGRLRLADQEITTSLTAGWSFASRVAGSDSVPLTRLARSYGGGIRFDEHRSRAFLSLRYGRDEMVGEAGWGQWLVAGQVPIKGTDGSLLLVGDASLMVGPAVDEPSTRGPRRTPARRDILRLGVAVDPVAAVRALRE